MIVNRLLVLASLILIPASALAQARVFKASDNPVTEAVRQLFASESKNIIAAADLLPAEKYAFHPTPAQMTFGQLIAHIVQTNMAICAGMSSLPPPMPMEQVMKIDDSGGKASLVPLLRQSFSFCGDALAKMTDLQLRDEATYSGRAMGLSRASAMVTIATDWADHYSTAAVYLRLNGLLPPSAPPAK